MNVNLPSSKPVSLRLPHGGYDEMMRIRVSEDHRSDKCMWISVDEHEIGEVIPARLYFA